MGVDGGAGNAISFSELQTFYGGSNPISLSEYYRNGSLVPGDLVAAQANTSGTTSQTIGQFTVTVSGTFNGALSSFTDSITFNNAQTVSITVAANTAIIATGIQHADKDGGSSTVSYTVNVGGTNVSITSNDSTGNGAFIQDAFWQGPAAFGATTSGADKGDLTTGTVVTLPFPGGENGRIRVKTRAGTSDVTFRNNNANTLTTTSGSTGGAQTYTQNQSRLVKNDSSTPNYTLGYNSVDGNTNVPTGGTINMNVFNAPGSATP
tara:strand:+ start:111 stop:902 length:792 start_codon:yes stop_codon:yes gene_type:complete